MNRDLLKKDPSKVQNPEDCPYLSPSSLITYMKALASELQKYNINLDIIKGLEFMGGFDVLVKDEFSRI